MGHVTSALPEVLPGPLPPKALKAKPVFRFTSLVISEPAAFKRKGTTMALSIALHSLLVATIVVLPLLFYDLLPTQDALKAFFTTPLEIMPAPPPPPPPAPVIRTAVRAPTAPPAVATGFVAPIEVPTEIKPEEGLDLGVSDGVAGGVEGGVPGGVVGGIVGGLPQEPPPPRVVRIGGQVVAPKLVRNVRPVYPELAINARLSTIVILEAQVDTHGFVKTVTVLRGNSLFDEAALAAVKQWRYQPLLLNGQPTEFILTVTVNFNLKSKDLQ